RPPSANSADWWAFNHGGEKRSPPVQVGIRKAKLTHNAGTQRFGDGLGFGVHMELLVHMLHVKCDCVGADVEFAGSRFVVVAFGEQLKQSEFVRSQVMGRGQRRAKVAKQAD